VTQPSILITGASGLLGRSLALRLAKAGERVIGIDRIAPREVSNEVIVADVLNSTALFALCEANDFGTIVHCGGVSGRAVAREDPHGTIRTNIMGTANVFEAARRFSIRRVVLASSGSIYGRTTNDPVREDALPQPVNAYGASKVASEAIMHAYARDWGVGGVALRIFQVFGPGRNTRCHVRTMIEAALNGRTAFIPHAADSQCQYLYVEDAIDALVSAIQTANLSGSIYNISGGTSLPLREIADIVSSVAGQVRVQFGDDPTGREYCLRGIDLSAARRDLNFVPKYSLAAGIAAYVRWMKTAGTCQAEATK
jgi:UDP-glucuronate 4-epimerase